MPTTGPVAGVFRPVVPGAADGDPRDEATRGEETTMAERHGVVVGVDGSEGSRAALQYALEDAGRRGTGVRAVVCVVFPEYWPAAYGLVPPPTIGELKDDLRGVAQRMIDDVVGDRPDLRTVPLELHAVEGRAATVLVEQSRGADLLVVGHRGRGGFGSAVLGSVGLRCVLHAHCPVVVVRPAPVPRTATEAAVGGAPPVRAGAGLGDVVVGPLY
jgi:nucleotide-binding universal stress UspA family protein